MRLGNFNKTPAERKRYAIDYSDWLDTGETLSSYTLTVSPSGGLTVDTASLTTGSTVLVFFASGGSSGSQYTLDVKANTSGGQIKEDTVLFNVRSA
jgi:hypothetical protein